MTWSDGARRCATHETSELTWEDEGRPFQINVKINARGAKLFLGVGGAHVAPTGIRIEDGASYAWGASTRSEEHTSELQSLMRISYAVFCLKKKTKTKYNKRIVYTHT